MISSAVVIPDAPREATPPSARSLKRRLSTSPSGDNKRPRVQVDELPYDEAQPQEESIFQSSDTARSNSNTSPPRRKSSTLGGNTAVEEKKRNKRLFGSLLGTLSQTATKPAHKKRDEIESRQRERMRQQTEEEEERRKRRKIEIDERRRAEHKLWEEESTRQRHRNMRDMAGFLKTKAEPVLYYKPWELRPEEQDDIARQKEDVERIIRRELGEHDQLNDQPVRSNLSPDSRNEDPDKAAGRHEEQLEHTIPRDENENSTKPDQATQESETLDPSRLDIRKDTNGKVEEEPHLAIKGDQQDSLPTRNEDHHGEELVEGQEDDVIY